VQPERRAVVVIGIEDQWTKKVVDGIATTGKPVAGFGIELHGDHDTIMRASKAAREFLQSASEKHREECELPELWVSTKCGESDTTSGCGANPTVGDAFDKLYASGCTLVFGETTELTGGEQIVAARCRDDKVRADFMRVFDRYQEVVNRHKTSDLSDSQPTKGNIAGGLTTIEEKALGNIQKIGKKCVVDGVLDKAEMPTSPGLWFMDSSSAAAEMVTLCAASGFAVHFFPTGQGNVIGNPDPAGHQDLRQSAHRAHDERARRRRHERPAAARDHDERGRRQAPRHDVPHGQRPVDGCRSAGTSRVRADPSVRIRLAPAARPSGSAPTRRSLYFEGVRLATASRGANPGGCPMQKLRRLIALALATVVLSPAASAELPEINIAQQYGIGYLSLMVMEEQKLVEKHAKAAGVDVKVNWAKFAGGNVMNDALLSGSLQFASGGVGR
jgi:hypothetical protein